MQHLILDTNVCGRLVQQPYADQFEKIKARLSRLYRRYIPIASYIELLVALLGGDGSFFERDRQRIRLLAGNGKPRFLSMPAAFALRHVLGKVAPAVEVTISHLESSFATLMRASDRESLLTGRVRSSLSARYGTGIDLESLVQSIQTGKQRHLAAVTEHQATTGSLPTREEWAIAAGEDVRVTLNSEEAIRLADAVDAAYVYYCGLLARLPSNYDFQKNANNWLDYQQLLYLADDKMLFVTDDRGLKHLTQKSSQGHRIVLLDDFIHGLLRC